MRGNRLAILTFGNVLTLIAAGACSSGSAERSTSDFRGAPARPSAPGAAGPSAAPAGPAGSGSGTPAAPAPSVGGAGAPALGAGGANCGAISREAVTMRRPADIIMAIDNSGSMDDEIGFVRERMNGFSQQIVASGVDVRIILISEAPEEIDDLENAICIDPPLGSGNCLADSQPPRYLHIPQEVGSQNALNLFIQTYPQWQSQLRPNSTKTFVVVTDDNAEDPPNNSAAAFEANVTALPGGLFANGWAFSGIYCFTDCDDAAGVGTVYADLVARRMGVGGDLCLQNFAPVFDALAQAVVEASALECSFEIPAPPAGQTFDRQQVNVQFTAAGASATNLPQVQSAAACGTREGWYYDDPLNPTRIHTCPQSCSALQSAAGAKVDVLFGCQTIVAPQ